MASPGSFRDSLNNFPDATVDSCTPFDASGESSECIPKCHFQNQAELPPANSESAHMAAAGYQNQASVGSLKHKRLVSLADAEPHLPSSESARFVCLDKKAGFQTKSSDSYNNDNSQQKEDSSIPQTHSFANKQCCFLKNSVDQTHRNLAWSETSNSNVNQQPAYSQQERPQPESFGVLRHQQRLFMGSRSQEQQWSVGLPPPPPPPPQWSRDSIQQQRWPRFPPPPPPPLPPLQWCMGSPAQHQWSRIKPPSTREQRTQCLSAVQQQSPGFIPPQPQTSMSSPATPPLSVCAPLPPQNVSPALSSLEQTQRHLYSLQQQLHSFSPSSCYSSVEGNMNNHAFKVLWDIGKTVHNLAEQHQNPHSQSKNKDAFMYSNQTSSTKMDSPISQIQSDNFLSPYHVKESFKDQEWFKKLQLSASRNLSKKPECLISVFEAQKMIREMLTTGGLLQQQIKHIKHIAETATAEAWEEEKEKTEQLRGKMEKLRKKITSKDVIKELESKINQRKKKRERLKRLKKLRYEEKQELLNKRQQLHQQLDEWQECIKQKEQDVKRDKEVKAAADATLSEVRKKISETAKILELIKALSKLRYVRKEVTSKKGVYTPLHYDKEFHEKVNDLKKMLTCQKEVYEGEEKTLKVMLETEQEETKEKERAHAKKRQAELEKKERKKRQELLFETTEVTQDNPLFPYKQYYSQAEASLEAFLQIRGSWDAFLVMETVSGASRIPDDWVVPVEPSSDIWASALKN